MILLYNSYDSANRDFKERCNAGTTFVDWYIDHDGRDSYALQGLPSPGIFPALVDEAEGCIFEDPENPEDLQRAIDLFHSFNLEPIHGPLSQKRFRRDFFNVEQGQ